MRVLAITLLMACAEPPTPAPRAANVSVPDWAESAPSARPQAVSTTTIAKPTITSLGNDEPKPLARGKKIDLDLVAADLGNVCRLIGELAGVNIVVSDGVTGIVTVKMRGVPWNEALDAILLSKGYHAEQLGSVIVVRSK